MTEEDLIRSAQDGDDASFDELVRQTLPSTYRFVRALGAGEDDAEDIVQDAYLRAWRALNRFDTEKPFRPWLFQIAKNVFFDLARKRKTIPFGELGSDQEDGALYIPDIELLPDALFEKEEIRVRVQEMLATLAPIEQTILNLRYDENFSFEEIAETLEKPAGTIRSTHHRALAKLRVILE